MADSLGSGRVSRLRRLLEERVLQDRSVEEDLAEELFDRLEQLDAEYEELLRGQGETEGLHRRFADLYEYAPVGYLVLNGKRIIIQVNETARRFLAPQPIDLGVSAIGPRISAETQEEYYDALRRSRESGEPSSAEFQILRSDGSTLWVSGRITCEAGRDGEVTGYRVILSDITERVLAQRQAGVLLEEKDLLLREIHHRVKNDFGLVSSFLALQAEDTENAALKKGMKEAQSRVQIMAQLYDTLHRQEQYTLVELKPFLEQVISGFLAGGRKAGLEANAEIEELTASSSLGVGLGLATNELLTNAKKYAVDDSRKLKITLSLRRLGADAVELQVADNGPGFPKPVIDGESLGFGLSVVHALAAQHDGSMSLENRDGAVIIVRMRLPE